MPELNTGAAPPPNGKGLAVLSVRDPLVESLLRGLGFEEQNLDEIRQFCKRLVVERNRHDIARRRGGLFGRIDKQDASRLLQPELAALAEAGLL